MSFISTGYQPSRPRQIVPPSVYDPELHDYDNCPECGNPVCLSKSARSDDGIIQHPCRWCAKTVTWYFDGMEERRVVLCL